MYLLLLSTFTNKKTRGKKVDCLKFNFDVSICSLFLSSVSLNIQKGFASLARSLIFDKLFMVFNLLIYLKSVSSRKCKYWGVSRVYENEVVHLIGLWKRCIGNGILWFFAWQIANLQIQDLRIQHFLLLHLRNIKHKCHAKCKWIQFYRQMVDFFKFQISNASNSFSKFYTVQE